MDRLEGHKQWFARLVTATAGVPPTEGRLTAALAFIPREQFLGPGPWRVFTRSGYIETPSDDPALIYQDVTVALKSEAQINNGQPSLHAVCLGSSSPRLQQTGFRAPLSKRLSCKALGRP
jgi:protein-L-isoaspartate(D-aspartate) O-methyltransferase